MNDVMKLLYANFLSNVGDTNWTKFVYGIVSDNYTIKKELFDFIDQYAADPDNLSIWRVKLYVMQWAPAEDHIN